MGRTCIEEPKQVPGHEGLWPAIIEGLRQATFYRLSQEKITPHNNLTMNNLGTTDPYELDPAQVRESPVRLMPTLKYLGPGLIITGNIIGSGELIATPALAARVGISALWLIIFSCVIKIFLQAEIARYTISSGETSLQALNGIPGPRYRISWSLWCYILMMLASFVQVGGIVGGIGQTINLLIPYVSPIAGSIFAAALAGSIIFIGNYGSFEKILVYMVATFSVVTIICAVSLPWTPNPPTYADFLEGMKFDLPEGGLAIAFGVFGLVGVGASELIYYPYWLIEKGYARFSGRSDGSPEWARRARGWIRVMYLDIILAMFVYTFATVAFFLLGVATLHHSGLIPEGFEMVRTLSNMYTQILGTWAFTAFLVGVFFVLFSTVLVATASNARIVADLIEIAGIYRFRDFAQRSRCFTVAALILLALFVVLYHWVGAPVIMVVVGGFAQATMLPVIAFAALYLRFSRLDKMLKPGSMIDILLVISSTLIIAFAFHRLTVQVLRLF